MIWRILILKIINSHLWIIGGYAICWFWKILKAILLVNVSICCSEISLNFASKFIKWNKMTIKCFVNLLIRLIEGIFHLQRPPIKNKKKKLMNKLWRILKWWWILQNSSDSSLHHSSVINLIAISQRLKKNLLRKKFLLKKNIKRRIRNKRQLKKNKNRMILVSMRKIKIKRRSLTWKRIWKTKMRKVLVINTILLYPIISSWIIVWAQK